MTMPENLQPLMGPRRTVGRLIAGETVPNAEAATDTSPFIRVWIDRDVQLPPLEAIGFIAQCAICPQKAVLHLQPPDGWTCPRCTEIAAPAVDMSEVRLGDRYPAPAPELVDNVESVRVETGHDIGIGHQAGVDFASSFFPQHQRPACGHEEPDWPIGQVCG